MMTQLRPMLVGVKIVLQFNVNKRNIKAILLGSLCVYKGGKVVERNGDGIGINLAETRTLLYAPRHDSIALHDRLLQCDFAKCIHIVNTNFCLTSHQISDAMYLYPLCTNCVFTFNVGTRT